MSIIVVAVVKQVFLIFCPVLHTRGGKKTSKGHGQLQEGRE